MILVAPASADDDHVAADSPCQGNELNDTATTSDGTTVRCLANKQNDFSWMADTGAAGTIRELQKEGYTVNIDRVGSGSLDQCKVIHDRNPITTTRTARPGPGASNVTTIIVGKTIQVSLDCDG